MGKPLLGEQMSREPFYKATREESLVGWKGETLDEEGTALLILLKMAETSNEGGPALLIGSKTAKETQREGDSPPRCVEKLDGRPLFVVLNQKEPSVAGRRRGGRKGPRCSGAVVAGQVLNVETPKGANTLGLWGVGRWQMNQTLKPQRVSHCC